LIAFAKLTITVIEPSNKGKEKTTNQSLFILETKETARYNILEGNPHTQETCRFWGCFSMSRKLRAISWSLPVWTLGT